MISFTNVFHQFLSKVITLAFTGFFSIYSLFTGVLAEPPSVPEDFTPVIRFVACSDVHINKEVNEETGEEHIDEVNVEKYNKVLETAYTIAQEDEKYNKLDAVIVAGDMTGSGFPEEYEVFMGITENHLKEGTEFVPCMGNHEFIAYRDNDATVAYDVYKQYVNGEVDLHTVINGYHFIAVSYDDNGDETFKTKTDWLREQLDIAVADTGDKPIFVIQHPHPALTVYGSINWGNFEIRTVLEKYPQVVDFSGHSHYAASDPRSIWQGSFTAVGCSGVTGAMGNLNYISGDQYGDGDSSAFWLVEVDAEGNIRLRLYDVVSGMFFDEIDYYLPSLSEKSSKVYNWANMYSLDTKPEFPEDAEISLVETEDGTTEISFPEARGYFRAENYKVSLSRGLENVYSATVLSDYTRANDFTKNINFGELSAGEYCVTVKAYSPYAKGGETLKLTFVVE